MHANPPYRITLPDGRSLSYARFGARDGRPVVYSHGFPASRLEASLLHAAATRAGVPLIAPDRPGLGGSDFLPGRTILAWAGDVRDLADQLGLDRFWLLGGSAGCPFALACAYRLCDRIVGGAIMAGLAPATSRESAAQMGGMARLGFFLARTRPRAFRLLYGALGALVARHPGIAYRLNEATPPDRAVLARPEIRSTLDASVREALRPGLRGALHEFALLAKPWGFDLESIAVPLQVWHGENDGVVPFAMGELLAARVPGARLHRVAGEGHVSLPVRHGEEILKSLVR